MSRKLAHAFSMMVLGVGMAFGQSTFGTLLGAVKDTSGAVVPNATVSIVHVVTNTTKAATNNSLGDYDLVNLLPGNYDVTVTATGFKQFVRCGVPLDPRATVRVDAQLISDLGLLQLGPFPKGSAIPGLSFEGPSGISAVSGARQEALREHKYQIADNVTWIHGRHTVKTGLDIRELRSADYENFIGPDNFGNYHFLDAFTGNDFADFLLGPPSFTEIVNAGPDFDGHATH